MLSKGAKEIEGRRRAPLSAVDVQRAPKRAFIVYTEPNTIQYNKIQYKESSVTHSMLRNSELTAGEDLPELLPRSSSKCKCSPTTYRSPATATETPKKSWKAASGP